MNLDEYRALKAQQEQTNGGEPNAQAEHTATTTTQEAVPQASEVPVPTVDTAIEEPQVETPTTIKYGEQEYSIEELIQAQRQASSIVQEQERLKAELEQAEVAQKYFNKMMENPEYARTFAENNGLDFHDPKDLKIQQLEKQYNKVLLDKEIENLQIKHPDFDAKTIIPFAVENQIKNLEDAFLLHKSKASQKAPENVDIASIKEQIRQELLNELKLSVNTDTLIGSGGTGAIHTQTATPTLTPAEMRVAKSLRMTPEQYIKYKTQ